MYQRSAFTLIEFATVVVIVAIVTIAAMPDPETEARQQGEIAADSFEAMVSYGRSLAIAQPDEKIVFKLDPTNERYWIAKAGTEDTPVTHPLTKRPYLTQVGPGTKLDQVSLYAADFNGDAKFYIDSQGFLDQAQPAVLQLTVGSQHVEISVAPSSGGCKVGQTLNEVLAPLNKGQEQGEQ